METKTDSLSGSICRSCLKLGAKKNIFSVHRTSSLTYSHIFTSCVPIDINPEDDLPKQICQKCLHTVLSFYQFKNKIIRNDLKLKQLLEVQKNKNITETLVNNDSLAIPCRDTIISTKNEDNLVQSNSSDTEINITVKNRDLSDDEISKCQEYPNFEASENFQELTDVGELEIHQCDICGTVLNSKSSLSQHYRKHTGQRPYACDTCGKSFYRAEHVSVHKRTHTGEKPHGCTICPKSFSQIAGLKAHLRVHTGECPFICCVCGKCFNHPSSLRYHKQIHSNEALHTCKVCKKSFKSAGYLKIHARFHEDKRPFPCEICHKKFYTSSHLNVHLKRHNNITSHKCIVCGKGFVRSQHLKIHLTTHTGERAFSCQLCPKKFSQQSHLNRHTKIHKNNRVQ